MIGPGSKELLYLLQLVSDTDTATKSFMGIIRTSESNNRAICSLDSYDQSV